MGGGGLHGDQMQRCNSLLDLVTAALQAFLNYHCHRYSRLAMVNFQPFLGSVNCLTFQQFCIYPAHARSRRACALKALGLLLADGAPTVGRGKTFRAVNRIFFTETALTPERKVEKSFPRSEINRHAEG